MTIKAHAILEAISPSGCIVEVKTDGDLYDSRDEAYEAIKVFIDSKFNMGTIRVVSAKFVFEEIES